MPALRPKLRLLRRSAAALAFAFACATASAQESPPPRATLEFVQTTPSGTKLGLDELREAHEVWPEMIAAATERIDLAHFYASNAPDSRLEPVIQALERAAARGVRVRFLADAKFHETYPETLDRLDDAAGIEVRLYDVAAVSGGVLHAKWMLIDGREGFLGSQNFDWRSLEHIQELGVRFSGAPLVAVFGELFEKDWAQAADETKPVDWLAHDALEVSAVTEGGTRVTPVYSPEGCMPRPELWDLPRLAAAIDSAQRSVRVQVLSYGALEHEGDGESAREVVWDGLEAPLRRAAARGVHVELLVSHWALAPGSVEGLQSLAKVPNVRVRVLTVPEGEGGFIPYARVAHAKLFVADGRVGWIGTSNWKRDYFYDSRNVGLLLEGGDAPSVLERFFAAGWSSPHAADLDPSRTYPKPRIGR